MSLTVRQVVELKLYRFLRKEDRAIPHTDNDKTDPLPEALEAINATLQELSALGPVFYPKQTKSALFRASESVTVTAAAQYGASITKATNWDDRMLGCRITLNGESLPNRIIAISTTTATLQNPILGAAATGSATVSYDCAELPSDVIEVLEPVRFVGGTPLRAANGRFNLDQPLYASNDDYGRTRLTPVDGADNSYYIETFTQEDTARPKLRMMLRDAPTSDSIVEYQARIAFGRYTTADVYRTGGPSTSTADPGTLIPVPAEFVESIFLPKAIARFYGSSLLQNVDLPAVIAAQVEQADRILASMRPQARKRPTFYPAYG